MTTAGSYPPTPYINAALLPKSVGKTVRIIGRVIGVSKEGFY